MQNWKAPSTLTLITLLFSLILFAPNQICHASQSKHATLSNALSVAQEYPQTDRSCFIAPNERHPYLYKEIIQDLEVNSAMIAVGTIRGLINAGFGKFRRVILMDYSKSEFEFNLLHIRLIAKIGKLPLPPHRQRYLYFAALHGKSLSEEQFKEIERHNLEEHSSALDIVFPHAFGLYQSYSPQAVTRPVFSPILEFPESIQSEMSELFSLNGSVRCSFLPYIFRIFYYEEMDRPKYYWEDDTAWIRLTALADAGHIQAVSGNVFGDTTLQSLGEELARTKEALSLIDISNIMHYKAHCSESSIQGSSSDSDYSDKKIELENWVSCRKKLIRNILSFSHTPKAQLFRTVPAFSPFFLGKTLGGFDFSMDACDGWNYTTVDLAEYVRTPSPTTPMPCRGP